MVSVGFLEPAVKQLLKSGVQQVQVQKCAAAVLVLQEMLQDM
jgi:hypothetical protein